MIRLLPLLIASVVSGAELSVTAVWSRATVAGQEAGAIFARIDGGDTDDRLMAAESSAANTVEIHEHAAGPDGVMQMRQVVGGVPIPAGTRIDLKPRSYHIMLIGLRSPLAKGGTVPVILQFEHHGRVTIEAVVLDPWAMAFDDR
jgi:periplasmic copper chaperone A